MLRNFEMCDNYDAVLATVSLLKDPINIDYLSDITLWGSP